MTSLLSSLTSSLQSDDVMTSPLTDSGSCFEAQVMSFAANPFVSAGSDDADATVRITRHVTGSSCVCDVILTLCVDSFAG